MANTDVLNARSGDVLECFLYPNFCYAQNSEQITEELLLEEIDKYNQKITIYTKDYMWHRDSLKFHPRTKRSILLQAIVEGSGHDEGEIVPHIHATLHFDEDVGDEWFTVFLIYNLTKVFDGLIARLSDSDGEFLLIETADALPSWSNPETCEKRVFISNALIHVIPDKNKLLIDMLRSVSDKPEVYKLSGEVQSIIQKKISIFPNEIQERKHKARAYLPDKAAAMLQQDPSLIAPAIRMLFHSDSFERKVCRGMRYFPPEQRTMVNVRMTKCLYAMIMHCRYTGDPMTGWNIPTVTSPTYNAHILGIKIACGLEILVASAHKGKRVKESDQNTELSNERLQIREKTLNTFVSRLELSGYFKGLLQGSQEREKLLQLAKEYFSKNSSSYEVSPPIVDSEADRALRVMQYVQTNDVEIPERDEASLSPADCDSWLNIDPAQLEKLLGERWTDKMSKTEKQSPLTLERRVQNFLKEPCDIEGVQLFGDSKSKTEVEDTGRIEFDTDAFDIALRDILDLVVPGDDGEFDDSSEGSLGRDDEDKCGEMDQYMRLLDTELQVEGVKDHATGTKESPEKVESNLMESLAREEGGSGPMGNIIGGPVRKFMQLQLQSPSSVPPDLQS